MKRNPITLATTAGALVALAVLGALATAPPTTAMSSALPTGNLVQNPGAETAPWAHDEEAIVTPVSWQAGGSWTQVAYGATGGFPDVNVSTNIGGGTGFFAAGPCGGCGFISMQQEIPISDPSVQAAIDAGNVELFGSAFIGGYLDDADSGEITVYFKNDAGKPMDGINMSTVERSGATTLLPAGISAYPVPKLTRTISVVLWGHHGGVGNYLDAYFDNISVELRMKYGVQLPPAKTTAPAATAPATTAPATTPVGTTIPATTTPPAGTTTPAKTPSASTKTTAAKKAKASLSLVCAGQTLIATVQPAKGSKTSSVWFYVNGKLRLKDRRAPFIAAIPTKDLHLPLTTAAAIQTQGKSTFLRKQFRGC